METDPGAAAGHDGSTVSGRVKYRERKARDPSTRLVPRMSLLTREQRLAEDRQRAAATSAADQFALFLLVLAVWWLPIPNPLKLLVVMFHELSHAVAAYLTGGVVFGIAVDPGGAGVTLGMGGHRFAVVSAGYVGSLLVGALLYWAGATRDAGDVWVALLLMTGAGSLIGWSNNFSEVFAAGSFFIMAVGLVVFPVWLKLAVVRVIATASCLYPIIDVMGEYGAWLTDSTDGFRLNDRVIGSDVAELALLTGLPMGFLSTAWCATGIAAVAILVRWSARRQAMATVTAPDRTEKKPAFKSPFYDPNRPGDAPEYTIR